MNFTVWIAAITLRNSAGWGWIKLSAPIVRGRMSKRRFLHFQPSRTGAKAERALAEVIPADLAIVEVAVLVIKFYLYYCLIYLDMV